MSTKFFCFLFHTKIDEKYLPSQAGTNFGQPGFAEEFFVDLYVHHMPDRQISEWHRSTTQADSRGRESIATADVCGTVGL